MTPGQVISSFGYATATAYSLQEFCHCEENYKEILETNGKILKKTICVLDG
jgi:hypothetical protein